MLKKHLIRILNLYSLSIQYFFNFIIDSRNKQCNKRAKPIKYCKHKIVKNTNIKNTGLVSTACIPETKAWKKLIEQKHKERYLMR